VGHKTVTPRNKRNVKIFNMLTYNIKVLSTNKILEEMEEEL
jgi:hypothetical protein